VPSARECPTRWSNFPGEAGTVRPARRKKTPPCGVRDDSLQRLGELELTTAWQRLRRRILTPDVSATDSVVRGFHVKNPSARDRLETIGRTFLTGYGYAAEADTPQGAEAGLESVAMAYRGFAYEGAAMGFAMRDGLPLGRADHVARFLSGRGDDHVYMVYVGVGWAMARLPRFRWARLTAPDPLLRWLVLDGYGFHQAYFHTARYVHGHHREADFPWPGDGPAWYADHVIDQGIGRACWFVGGADPRVVTGLADRFPESRRADLYAGIGLAATYAGGADEEELVWLWRHAGQYRPQLAQGAAFAAGARVRAGLVVPHNDLATSVFCGMDSKDAAKVTDVAREGLPYDGPQPAFEVWRQRIAGEFASREGAAG
jgi:enediyne biosynthesis protein E3